MQKQHVYIGFYSSEAARKYGVVIYRNELGQKIAVTCVVKMPREHAMQWFQGEYKWPDKKVVAEVCDDCIGRIEGEWVTQTVCHSTPFGFERHEVSTHVPGTPGVFKAFNSFWPTEEEKAELVDIAKQTTGYSPFAPSATPVASYTNQRLLDFATNPPIDWSKVDLTKIDWENPMIRRYKSFFGSTKLDSGRERCNECNRKQH